MESTTIWQKYEKSKQYLDQKSLVTKTEKNWNFYIGKQWEGIGDGDMKGELPSMNFIKPTVKYKVSTVCQHAMTANYSDIRSDGQNEHVYEVLNRKFSQSWEKAKMNTVAWKVVKASAIQGDSYLFWGTDKTTDVPQVINNTSVLLGDENTRELETQPYIIIRERYDIEYVKRIAKENGVSDEEIETIVSDDDTTNTLLNKTEVSNKVTCLLYMDKDKDGVVRVARTTRTVEFEKLRRIESTQRDSAIGLKRYPIINFVWEEKPNDARGISEVELLIPNQVEANKTLARRSLTVKITAFPRLAYDVNAVSNPDDLEKVGAPIGVTTGGAQSINQAIAYLNAANISSDADKLSTDLITNTKELAGAGDFAMGNINPERASGNAIIAVRDQSQVPLNEQVSAYTQFVEDVALLWYDMWITFEPEEFGDGEEVSLESLLELKPTVRIDVSQDNQWTKLAEQQAIDNLLMQKLISLEEYALLISANGAIPKGKLLNIINQRKAMQQEMQNNMPQEMPMEGAEQEETQEEVPTEAQGVAME